MISSASLWLLPLALCLSLSVSARADSARLEYAFRIDSDDLEHMHTLSLSTPRDSRLTGGIYAIADLNWYRLSEDTDGDVTTRVALGLASQGTLAPYVEFGTSLYDLVFVILDKILDDDTDVDNNECTASSTYNCKLDTTSSSVCASH